MPGRPLRPTALRSPRRRGAPGGRALAARSGVSCPPGARSSSAARWRRSPAAPTSAARETSVFAIRERGRHRRSPRGRGAGPEGARAVCRDEPGRARRTRARATGRGAADGRRRRLRPRLPAHAADRVVPERRGRGRARGQARRGSSPPAAGSSPASRASDAGACRGSGCRRGGARGRRVPAGGPGRERRAARSPSPSRFPARDPQRIAHRRAPSSSTSAPVSSCASATLPISGSSSRSRAGRSAVLPAGTTYLDVSVPDRPVAGAEHRAPEPSSLKWRLTV